MGAAAQRTLPLFQNEPTAVVWVPAEISEVAVRAASPEMGPRARSCSSAREVQGGELELAEPAPNGPEDVGWSEADRGRAPLRFRIPNDAPESKCRSCRAPIFWIVTPRGRQMPVEPDGTSHFAACPNADSHRRRRR